MNLLFLILFIIASGLALVWIVQLFEWYGHYLNFILPPVMRTKKND